MTDSKPVFKFYSDELKARTIQESDGKTRYYVEGYVSTGDLDLVNDIVTKRCLDSMLSQFDSRNIKLDFEHETMVGETELQAETAKARIPLGKAVNKGRDENGVLVQWELNSSWKKFDEKGNVVFDFKNIWDNVQDGYYDAFSIAFVPTETKGVERDGKNIRLLDNVNLLNVALTGNPVNQGATMSAAVAKSLEAIKKNNPEKEEEDLSLVEVKDQDNTQQDSKKDNGGMMTDPEQKDASKTEVKDEGTQTPTPEGESKGSENPEPKAEPAPEPKAEPEAKPEGEGKSKELEEVSKDILDLKNKVEEISKEQADFKSFLEKANRKAVGPEDDSKKPGVNQKSSKGPLDHI